MAIFLAGMEGFEPPNAGIKTRCLTTWRHPNSMTIVANFFIKIKCLINYCVYVKILIVKTKHKLIDKFKYYFDIKT